MRRYNKRKLIEDFDSLFELHDRIGTELKEDAHAQVSALLARCQETAILAGNRLEEDGGSHQNAVRVLEEYCEALYLQSLDLPEYTMRSRLDACITQVREYVRQQVNEILEVVFLPYKASMWDSLESVWRAAKEDENCAAYVVAIPYFDKNPDGTVSSMHYEGGEFPADVPIVGWQEYDLAKRHPDIIFIHNPYDQANNMTSVHLDYYAKELKKHTDQLVYIPYFVCVNDNIPAHLCVLPGSLYADKVIVQSEKMREIYIREFHKFEEESSCEGIFGIAEEKFLALGSPKYDKVMQATRESVFVPEDWKRKLYKTDGCRRKILLYNTSLVQLLQGNAQVLRKIRSVFEQMKNREDAVLLWRPHPLSETAYDAMRPQYAKEYRGIVEQYRNEDWGIYDDTPDLHRAIVLSDAYYGDWSSLVELYRITGKPVMIQNLQII